MTEPPPESLRCTRCHRTFDPHEPGADPEAEYCPQCALEMAEDVIPAPESGPRKPRLGRIWSVGRWVIIAACIAVIVSQTPRMLSTFQPLKPIRRGTYATNATADDCIDNLWKAAALLQQEKRPGPGLVCPASGRPYNITMEGDRVVVRCPNPELHELRSLQVNSESPVPKVRR